MPGRRLAGRRRGAARRKGGRKGFKKAVARVVADTIAEKKYYDVGFARDMQIQDGGSGNAWQLLPITNMTTGSGIDSYVTSPPQDASVNGRVGKKISLRYVQLRLMCKIGPAFTTKLPFGYMIKFAFVWDKEPNSMASGSFANTLIWNTPPNGVGWMDSQRNHDTAGRFVVLGTAQMAMSPQVLCPCAVEHYIDLKGKRVEYTGIGSAMSGVNKGALSVWWCGSSIWEHTVGTLTDVVLDLDGTSRCVFVDI